MNQLVYRLVETIGSVVITHCPEPANGQPKYCVLDSNCQEIATAQTLEEARRSA